MLYMDIKTLVAECTAYDYKEMLEENKPKSWLKSVSVACLAVEGEGGSLYAILLCGGRSTHSLCKGG